MAWTEKHGKRYRGRYIDANNKRHTAGWSTSKREALRMAQVEEMRIRKGTWRDPSLGSMLFSEYFESHWLPHRLREKNTIAAYRAHYNSSLKDAFGDVEVQNIAPAMVQRWVSERAAAGVKPGTIRAHYRTLATVLGARKGVSAVRDGLISRSPCDGIELPELDTREVTVYSVPELDALMLEIDPWWQLIPLLAADSGLRWGELMGLYVSDFTEGCRAGTSDGRCLS
ncbi:MAG: tyrosine-type recombinase/integrase [Nocardioides sp.]